MCKERGGVLCRNRARLRGDADIAVNKPPDFGGEVPMSAKHPVAAQHTAAVFRRRGRAEIYAPEIKLITFTM